MGERHAERLSGQTAAPPTARAYRLAASPRGPARRRGLRLGVLLAVVTPAVAAGQPVTGQPVTGQPAAGAAGRVAADASAAREALDASFAAYQQAIRQFEALRTEFQTADAARQQQINAELGGQFLNLKRKVDAMVADALALYQAAPNADPQVTKLLLDVAEHDTLGEGDNAQGGDNYERALAVIDALVAGGQAEENPWLLACGLLSAFVTGELDRAAEYRELAGRVKLFEQAPPRTPPAMADIYGNAAMSARAIEPEKRVWQAERAIRQREAEADDLPRVKLATSKGEIVLELLENEAPNTVANFLTLVKDGFYTGLAFHRVLPGFMAQGGDPDGDGTGGPGYLIPCECYRPDFRRHFRGSLSMAKRPERDTGGSQFFLTFIPTRQLDGKHTVFGRVIDGMPVLSALQRIDPEKPAGVQPDRILKAEVLRDRGHAYPVTKLPGR